MRAEEGDATTAYTTLFRRAAFASVEFSFADDPREYTTMVAGGGELPARALDFSAYLPFAAPWSWSAAQFVESVRPDTYLFRVDWRDQRAHALSLYCRFPAEPDDIEFAAALESAAPASWTGPPPSAVAAALDLAGPRGVALRVRDDSQLYIAVYFKVTVPASALPSGGLMRLLSAVGLPVGLADTIDSDMRALFGRGSVGIIGLDPGRDGVPGGLKLNPANVPTRQALRFLAAHGVPSRRIGELAAVTSNLRARSVSYLGVRYLPHGFAGWRLYLSVEPQRLPTAGAPALTTTRTSVPTLALPHY